MSTHVFDPVSYLPLPPAQEYQDFLRSNDSRVRIARAIAERMIENTRKKLRIYFYGMQEGTKCSRNPLHMEKEEGRHSCSILPVTHPATYAEWPRGLIG